MTVSEVEQNQQLPCPEQQTPRPDQPQQQKEENKMSNETLVNGGSQQPQNGDPRLEDGKRLLATRKYNEAVDLLGQLAKDLTTKYDSNPLHPELGPVWFLYGQALYQLATSQAPLLGSSVAEEVPVAIDEKALTNGKTVSYILLPVSNSCVYN
jgi:hypothetical protein